MNRSKRMLVENVAWAHETASNDGEFFSRLAQGQQPKVLWLGCSDSRVPAETIVNANPGELFVHRNIANLFAPDDDNTMSVLEYAVRVLKVTDVVVCGHYGCGGIRASLSPAPADLPHLSRRIAPLYALARQHQTELAAVADIDARVNRLAELSVLEQVRQLRATQVVQQAEAALRVHGWIYGLHDGRLKVLAAGDEMLAAMPLQVSSPVLQAVPTH